MFWRELGGGVPVFVCVLRVSTYVLIELEERPELGIIVLLESCITVLSCR